LASAAKTTDPVCQTRMSKTYM